MRWRGSDLDSARLARDIRAYLDKNITSRDITQQDIDTMIINLLSDPEALKSYVKSKQK